MKALEPRLRCAEYGALRVVPILIGHSRHDAGEQFNALLDGGYDIDMKSTIRDRIDHIAPQHQSVAVLLWNEHALTTRDTFGGAYIEERFNLFVKAAHRQNT